MLKTLIRVRFAAYFASLSGAQRKNRKPSKGKTVLFLLLMVYCFAAFSVMFFGLFAQMAQPYYEAGLSWLYFSFFGLTAFALMFVGSVFTAKSQLFEARDNELLLAMPIHPRDILGSRMAALVLLNFLLELPVAIPALAAWLVNEPLKAAGIVSFAVLALALPFLAMALSGLIAWILSLLTARVRNKSLMTTIFSLVFLGAYFYVVSQLNQYLNRLIAGGAAIAEKLGAVAPVYWLGDAAGNGNLLSLLFFVLLSAAAFAILYFLLARSFIRILTTKRGFAKIQYREKALAVSKPDAALFRRELRRLGSSPSYMLNAGLGLAFIVAAAVFLVAARARMAMILLQLGLYGGEAAAAAALVSCMIGGMVLFTASSVSLEGRTIWILRSLPVGTRDILRAKLRLSFRLTGPCVLLFSLAALWLVKPDPVSAAGLLAAPLLFTALAGNLGLMENLRHVNLDWINEAQPVKQGAAVIYTMLLLWALSIGPGLAYLFLAKSLSSGAFLAIYCALLLALLLLTNRWLDKTGVRLFEELG
jgi:ABC-2 type transport system permease protein